MRISRCAGGSSADRRGPDRARPRSQARPRHLLRGRQRRHPPGDRSRRRRTAVRGRRRAAGSDGATVVVFTGIDTNFTPVFRSIRGKVAIYNENIRAIADRYDCIVADQWALREVQDMRFFDDDRLHYNRLGHHEVARMVLRALNVPNDLQPMRPIRCRTARGARRARMTSCGRASTSCRGSCAGVRQQSSGDEITAKRPDPMPVTDPRLRRQDARGRQPRTSARSSVPRSSQNATAPTPRRR